MRIFAVSDLHTDFADRQTNGFFSRSRIQRPSCVGACEVRMFPGGYFYLNSSQAIFLQTFAGDLLRLRIQY